MYRSIRDRYSIGLLKIIHLDTEWYIKKLEANLG